MRCNKLKLCLGLIILLLASSLVYAFGVTAPYWDSNPLVMYPGQETEFALLLQNMVSDEEVILQAELIEGSEIAAITDSSLEYIIPPGRKDISVNLNIKIPEDALLDAKYTVGVSFKQVTADEGKMMQMTGGVEKYIPIVVKSREEVESLSEPEETQKTPEQGTQLVVGSLSSTTIAVLLVVLLAVIVGYVLLKRKKK